MGTPESCVSCWHATKVARLLSDSPALTPEALQRLAGLDERLKASAISTSSLRLSLSIPVIDCSTPRPIGRDQTMLGQARPLLSDLER